MKLLTFLSWPLQLQTVHHFTSVFSPFHAVPSAVCSLAKFSSAARILRTFCHLNLGLPHWLSLINHYNFSFISQHMPHPLYPSALPQRLYICLLTQFPNFCILSSPLFIHFLHSSKHLVLYFQNYQLSLYFLC